MFYPRFLLLSVDKYSFFPRLISSNIYALPIFQIIYAADKNAFCITDKKSSKEYCFLWILYLIPHSPAPEFSSQVISSHVSSFSPLQWVLSVSKKYLIIFYLKIFFKTLILILLFFNLPVSPRTMIFS